VNNEKMIKTIEQLAADLGYTVDIHDGICNLQYPDAAIRWTNATIKDVHDYLKSDIIKTSINAVSIANISGCSTDLFNVVGDIRLKKNRRILLMQKKSGGAFQWCVKPLKYTDGRYHAVSGKYFNNWCSMMDYAITVCGQLTNVERIELDRAYWNHSHTGKPLIIPT